MTRTLIFGGARSGKSAYAERTALTSSKEIVYVATARVGDAEMETRINLHKQQRDPSWIVVEEPLNLASAVTSWSSPRRVVLIDCLTVWLSNLTFAKHQCFPEVGPIDPPAEFDHHRSCFLKALQDAPGDLIMVSNEVGAGVVPLGAISRWFVDESGRLNQAVAQQCERVVLVAAGLPLILKGP